ncbi:MAG: hypothetical protein QM755_01865 [Luteolibacter sp.]
MIAGHIGGPPVLGLLMFVVAAFILTAAAAWVSWQVLERPMLSEALFPLRGRPLS